MKQYDVIQIDDYSRNREACGYVCYFGGVSYLGFDCLNSLRRGLSEGARARIYLVDSNFPEEEGGIARFLAPEAIKAIRESHPRSRIFPISGLEEAKTAARELKVTLLNPEEFRYPEIFKLFEDPDRLYMGGSLFT